MKLSGVNTYEGTQIDENQSKFNLNCYNRDGLLSGYNYNIEFNIPMLKVYEREYDCLDEGNPTTSSDVSREELRYYYEDGTYTSGIVKPACTLYLDTTKFENGDNTTYCKKITELNGYATFNNIEYYGQPLVGDRLLEAVKNFATDTEVYRDVEVSVSYSGAYGESGMTKFRITSNMLHFFVVVHDVFKYEENPNYKYVNIYIKYASIDSPVLLRKVSLEELRENKGKPIDLASDTRDREFAVTYRGAGLGYTDDVAKVHTKDPDNKLVTSLDYNAIIYSGLFQFEDENRVNPSWFVTSKVTSIAPLANVEIQTYLSAEEYDIEDNVNEYLDNAYKTSDTISEAYNELPVLTGDTHCIEFIDNLVETDRYKWSTRLWNSGSAGVPTSTTRDIQSSAMGGVANNGGLIRDWLYGESAVYDIYNYPSSNSDSIKNYKKNYTGQFIIQYIRVDDTSEPLLINTTPVTITGSKYSILSFQNITENLSEDYDWVIDIWFNPSVDDVPLDLSYRVFSINVNKTYADFEANYASNKVSFDDEYSLLQWAMRNTVTAYNRKNSGGTQEVYPARSYGYANFEDSDSDGLYICLAPQGVTTFPDLYEVDTLESGTIPPTNLLPLSDDFNNTDDLSDIQYDPDGRFENDYNTYKDGISNTPQYDYPKWNVNMRHIEKYDGRLWTASKVKVEPPTLTYTVDDIVDNLPDNPTLGDIYAYQVVGLDASIKEWDGDSWLTTAISFDQKLYNNADRNTYSAKTVDYGVLHFELCCGSLDSYRDLYYSEQGYPEMILETNYKGYDYNITGLHEFIEQLYVFQDEQIDIVKKNLTREVAGIVEPTYQYHKSFDKGAIEFTVKEYEKKVFFTNDEGIFYIDAGGNYNKVSDNIDRLFTRGSITSDTVDYAEIKKDFYVVKLTEAGRIPFNVFSGLNLSYADTRYLYVEYIAFNIKTGTFWFGNDATGRDMFFYLTKDFTQRNKYENQFKKKQLKRISMMYDGGKCKVDQIRNNSTIIGSFWYADKEPCQVGMPKRHTILGYRNFSYSFLISSEFATEITDFALIENGK